MKKHYSLIIAVLLAGFSVFTSCKQNDDPPPPTNTEKMSSLPWKFSAATAGGTDVSAAPQLACFKDNIITFTALGAGSINEGAIVCAPSTSGSFTWTFQSAETQLNTVSANPLVPGGTNTFTIVSLTTSNLVLSQSVNIGAPTVVTFTFIH